MMSLAALFNRLTAGPAGDYGPGHVLARSNCLHRRAQNLPPDLPGALSPPDTHRIVFAMPIADRCVPALRLFQP